MERSTVYILVRKTDLDNLKNKSKDLYNQLFGQKVNDGWASIKDYYGEVRGNRERLSLITIDDIKWCRCFSDVDAIYTKFILLLDYWEIGEIREDGASSFQADDETISDGMLIESISDVDLSNLEPVGNEVKISDIPEFIGQVIDVCEDFLDEEGITIQNEERDEAIASGEDADGLAQIYGSHYDLIAGVMRRTLEKNICCNTKLTSDEVQSLSAKVVETTLFELSRNDINDNQYNHAKDLQKKIIETFKNWELVSDEMGKYMLISVVDRNITTHSFKTYEDAREMMNLEFYDTVEDENIDIDERDIDQFSAWISGCDNDYDWKIVKTA